MANWELLQVIPDRCDQCNQFSTVNVYRKLVGTRLYRFFHVCGMCLDEWLKRQQQFMDGIDYGN